MPVPNQFVLEQTFEWTSQFLAADGTPVDADSPPSYSIYEDGTAIGEFKITGTMEKLDDANTVGLYRGSVEATAVAGFERFKTYNVHVTGEVSAVDIATVGSSLCVGGSDTIQTTEGALTTLANFKDYVGITGSGDDSLISALINRSTSAIQKFTGRDLIETNYREVQDWDGSSDITSDQYPIILIASLNTSRDGVLGVKYTGAAWSASVRVSATTLTLTTTTGALASATEISLPIKNTLAKLATAINDESGWETTTLTSDVEDVGSIFLLPISGLTAKDTFADLEIPSSPANTYVVDNEAGIISEVSLFPTTRTWTGRQNLILQYTAGYATTPADLEQIAIDLTKVYYDGRQRDGGLKSEKIGDYSYTVGDVASGNMPDSIKLRLSGYVRRVL